MPYFSLAGRASKIISLFPLAGLQLQAVRPSRPSRLTPKMFGSYTVKVEYRPEDAFQKKMELMRFI